jgi:hypothetical protein
MCYYDYTQDQSKFKQTQSTKYVFYINIKIQTKSTSRNQPKCNLRLHATCNLLQLDLGIVATTRPNFNYFSHFNKYDATIKNFILLVGSILHLFSSINRLICPISHNNHQISYILKVFYNDIGVYFNVCIKIIYIYIICICMYIVHIMNLKINI